MTQCVYWRSRNCRKGASCLFAHSADAPLPPCKYGSQCRFGKACMFGHPEREGNIGQTMQQSKPAANSYGPPMTQRGAPMQQRYGQTPQFYAGTTGGSASGYAGNPATSGPPGGGMPPSANMGSPSAAPPTRYSRVPSTNTYGNMMGAPQYPTHFAPSSYGHPYSGMQMPSHYAPPTRSQGMSPRQPTAKRPAAPQQMQTPSQYANMPRPGQGHAGGGIAGTHSTMTQAPPQVMRSNMDAMVPSEARVTQLAPTSDDPEAVIATGIQGMQI